MFGMCDVECGMFAGMWDVDLENAKFSHSLFQLKSLEDLMPFEKKVPP